VTGFSSRFPNLLRSGSLVFKSTRYREWFHGRLLPYVDYIPVNYDLTDLVEKVEWVHHHNQQQHLAERIVQHSRQRVEQLLRPAEMQCYMYRLLLEYQTLFEEPPAGPSS
jgi:Glycosyl transferase family 90